MHKKAITIILVIIILALLLMIPFADMLSPVEQVISQVEEVVPVEVLSMLGEAGIGLFHLLIGIIVVVLILIIVIVNLKGRKKKDNSVSSREVATKGVISQESFGVGDNRRTRHQNPKFRKSELLEELKAAEKKYLKHEIDKPTFDKISREKNAELIKLEAESDTKKKETMNFAEAKAMESVSKDKRKVLSDLMDQKQKKVHELKLAERGYLKRKIDEKAFKKMNSDIKQEMISIEGKIKAIQKSEEIEKIRAKLLEGAREIAKQKVSSGERKQAQPHTFEDDVFKQLDYGD